MEHPHGGLAGCFVEIRREHAVGAKQHDLFQTGHFFGLARNKSAFGNEDRIVDDLRLAGGDLGQNRAHVRVVGRNGFHGGDGAAHRFKFFGKHLGQLFGVDAAVMNRGRSFETLLSKGKISRNCALDLVVVGGPQIPPVA